MSAETFTVADAEAIIPIALGKGDLKAVEACLYFLATRAPDVAQRYIDTMQMGLSIAANGDFP